MSRENVDVVRRAYEAFNRGDLEGLLDFIDPRLRYVRGLPQNRTVTGFKTLRVSSVLVV